MFTNHRTIVTASTTALAALLGSATAHAGASVGGLVYAPAAAGSTPSGVPTLSGSLLIVLSLLLATLALRMFRKQGGKLLLLLLGGGALAAGSGGVKLISDAIAATTHQLSNPAGGTATVDGATDNIYVNSSGVRLRITLVQLNNLGEGGGCPNNPSPTRCEPGNELDNGEQCNIDCVIAGGE